VLYKRSTYLTELMPFVSTWNVTADAGSKTMQVRVMV